MKSIRQQLEEQGVAADSRVSKNGKRRNKPQNKARDYRGESARAILQLPLLGKVNSTKEERGFGFLRTAEQKTDLFFHIYGRCAIPEGGERALPADGDLVVLILGNDPHKPERTSAVRWARVDDLHWPNGDVPGNQCQLDGVRRELLLKQPLGSLWKITDAAWYKAACNKSGTTPLASLNDPILGEVLWKRLYQMTESDLSNENAGTKLIRGLYNFCTPRIGLDFCSPAQLAILGQPESGWMKAANRAKKCKLMEWYLSTGATRETQEHWRPWFSGEWDFEPDVASQCLANGLVVNDFTCEWIKTLVDTKKLAPEQVGTWSEKSSYAAVRFFQYLPRSGQAEYLDLWKKEPKALEALLKNDSALGASMVEQMALAVDLETDGADIWEVGSACRGGSELLYDEQTGGCFPDAMAVLKKRVDKAVLLVGHNMLAWDWPILRQYLATKNIPLIWDTLLIQFLLEPQAVSHALSGNHHADGDAAKTLALFADQLARVPETVTRSLLCGEFANSGELLEAVGKAVSSEVQPAAQMPKAYCLSEDESIPVTVLPEARIRELNWVPDVAVIPANADENLPESLLQLDADKLERNLATESSLEPAAVVLLAVARIAEKQAIALRRNMIPSWLVQKGTPLACAVQVACVLPDTTGKRCFAPLPVNLEWWRSMDGSRHRVVLSGRQTVILDRRETAPREQVEKVAGDSRADFVRLGAEEGSSWLCVDRPASVLSHRGGWRSFSTFELQAGQLFPQNDVYPSVAKPVFCIRYVPVLYPNATDQDVYWIEVLRAFQEIVGKQGSGIPILLVASTHDRQVIELLRDGLLEIGLGERWPAHHSRRRHLLRASRQRVGLVDHLDNWPQWQSLSQDADIKLLPVVEALPLEEWYALSATESSKDSEQPDSPEQYGDEFDSKTVRITPARILENLTQLVTANLAAWLVETGLTVSSQAVWVMDSRIAGREAALAKCGDFLALDGPDFSEQQMSVLRTLFSDFRVEREDAPSDFASMEQFLIKNWQRAKKDEKNPIRGFKESQKTAMEAICNRSSDVLVALPTGEGKSVLFQVPAFARGLRNRRLTLVISPLKALMHDQVQTLERLGFAESTEYLSSDRSRFEIMDALQGVLDHRVVLLYVAPERLRSKPFVDVLHKRAMTDGGLEYVVVDETHCVNQWGYEFRPDYFYALDLLLRYYRQIANDVTPFLLFSATVTASDKHCLKGILTQHDSGESLLPFLSRPEQSPFPLGSYISIQPQYARGRINSRDEFDKALESRFPWIQDVVHKAMANRKSTGQRSAVVIFVSRRNHAESLAAKLVRETNATADFFHAGLDSDTRTEVYTQFKSGGIDVLVATKAFGMGMDIPDIHWAIHLAPPTYLEDYLQEVGRIGRGGAEREMAQLEQLQAIMLFSADDFEGNRSQQAVGALQRHNVEDLDREIREHTGTIEGQDIVILPETGFEPLEHWWQHDSRVNQIRLSLYWLERAGRIDICARVPDLISVTIFPSALERIVDEDGELGKAARLILDMNGAVPEVADSAGSDICSTAHQASETNVLDDRRSNGLLGSLLSRLGDMVGILFNTESKSHSSSGRASVKPGSAYSNMLGRSTRPAVTRHGDKQGVLNIKQLMFRLAFTQPGQVMACIVDLSNRGGLAIEERVRFAKHSLSEESSDHIQALFGAVRASVEELVRRLENNDHHVRFLPEELAEERPSINVDGKIRTQYERAYVNGMRTLARASGIRLKQVVNEDGKVRWDARMPTSKRVDVKSNKERIIRNTRSLFDVLVQIASRSDSLVSVTDLVQSVRDTHDQRLFKFRQLENAQRLLASMKLFSFSSEMLPMSYILTVNEVDTTWDDLEVLWQELQEVNELAAVRCQAMEVFASLPVEAQNQFITGYFRQSNSQELNQFLDSQLGEIDSETEDGALSGFIVDKRQQLRATEIKKHFERYEESEETNQWEVIRESWDRHVLVNAGPGAGKTAVLVARIAHLINKHNIPPGEIVVLAFNRAVVFEIKKRLKELFQSIGYAAYVGRLRVSTFHSLAVRSLAESGDLDRLRGEGADLLEAFAAKLTRDANFRKDVAGGCRCILMDEFQDATQNVYEILRQLHAGGHARAGVTVIGDDDQDILRWNRLKTGGSEFSEAYFEAFKRDFGDRELVQLELGVNFRSDQQIVDCSQRMIDKVLGQNEQSNRLKILKLKPRADANVGDVHREDWRGKSWTKALDYIVDTKQPAPLNGSLAILCRTNAEVAEAYGVLTKSLDGLSVQGCANLRVGRLRHAALWLEFIDQEIALNDQVLTSELKEHLFCSFTSDVSIPEVPHLDASGVDLAEVWDLCAREKAYPHLSDLSKFISGLWTEDVERLRGESEDHVGPIISTIHKVKGLQFDEVIVLPSRHGFGERKQPETMLRDAAEEARLQYVAMTRAKSRLVYFVGDREFSWANLTAPRMYEGEGGGGQWLTGSPEDVFLNWPMQYTIYNRNPEASQKYIEQQVQVGDEIILGGQEGGVGKVLMHRAKNRQLTQIGFLAKKYRRGGAAAALTVSAVVRHIPSEDRANQLLAESVQQRGWGYTVLVNGRLR